MGEKQIYAALEIADYEIRLIVGEFHNTRFNVMKVERVETTGIEGQTIVNEALVTTSIQKAVANASHLIGLPITKVLLVIPSQKMERFSKVVTVDVKNDSKKIGMNDVRSCIKSVLNAEIPQSLEIVNYVCNRYMIQGAWTKKAPIGEVSEQLTMEIDLLCADRMIVYQYAKCVEAASLEIIEIGLDMYAIGKESSILESTDNEYTISMRLERQSTTLSLVHKGKLISAEVIMKGYGQLISLICDTYTLPTSVASRLFMNNCRYSVSSSNAVVSSAPIYLWSVDTKRHTLSEKQIYDLIMPHLIKWIEELKNICEPILNQENVSLVIHGEGAEILGLSEIVHDIFKVEVNLYVPETLGVRTSALTACLGMFYMYKDQSNLRIESINSVDVLDFEKMIYSKRQKSNPMEDSLTNRFKGIFEKKKVVN